MAIDPSQETRSVSRRTLLVSGSVAGGLAWAAPSLLGFEHALAALSPGGPPPTIVVGAASTLVHGNSAKAPAIPAGTSTIYLLVISINADAAGDIDTPTITGGPWTQVTPTTPVNAAHQILVFSTTNPTGTTVQMQGNNNDNWLMQMFGISAGTTATAAAVASSTGGTAMSVASPAAASATTSFLLIGTSLGITSATNWSVPAGFTSKSDLNRDPDISLSQYNTLGTAPGTQTVSYGAGTFAHAVQIAIN